MNCDGCDIDLDVEATVVIDTLNGSVCYNLCGFCASRVENFILKDLP